MQAKEIFPCVKYFGVEGGSEAYLGSRVGIVIGCFKMKPRTVILSVIG